MSIYSKSFSQSIIQNPNTSLAKIINQIDFVPKTILDIGCSSGYFGQYLKKRYSSQVWGIEKDKLDVKKAQKKLDKVLELDLNISNNFKKFPNHYFDLIICADVIEHLISPQLFLSKITKKLSTSGKIIFSIPNVLHQSIIVEMLMGEWNYEKSGLLDQTHLHFFDFNHIQKLLSNSHLQIISIDYTTSQIPFNYINSIFRKKYNSKQIKLIDKILNQPQNQVFQYIIKAKYTSQKIYKIKHPPILIHTDWLTHYQNIYNQYNQLTAEKEKILPTIKNLFRLFLKNFKYGFKK